MAGLNLNKNCGAFRSREWYAASVPDWLIILMSRSNWFAW